MSKEFTITRRWSDVSVTREELERPLRERRKVTEAAFRLGNFPDWQLCGASHLPHLHFITSCATYSNSQGIMSLCGLLCHIQWDNGEPEIPSDKPVCVKCLDAVARGESMDSVYNELLERITNEE